MKTPLPLTTKGTTRNFIKKMLRAKHLLVMLALSAGLLFNASKAFSQTTTNESFEGGPQDGTAFTSNGQAFTIGSNVSGPFVFDLLAGYGWNGTTADDWLIDNYSSYSTVSPSFFINSAQTFKVNHFWVQLLADLPPPRLSGGTLVVSGSLAGNPVYTETFSSGFNTDITTNNGYTLIALTGTDAGKVIDKITISADNLIYNIVLDGFNWTSTATTTVTSITNAGASPTNAASVNYTVKLGSAVTGLSASNFSLTTTGVTGAAVGTPTTADGGVTWTVPVTTGTGDGTIILNLANGAGLSKALTTTLPFVGSTYTIDKTPPTVVSINRVGPSPNNAVTDQFTVTFSEAVTGVDITDFSLTNTGVTGTIASVTGSGSTYTVTVNTVAGSGTMRLDLNPSGTGIIDLATNPIAGGFTTGQVYSIDQTAPTVTISAPSVAATAVGPVTYTITYSDANFNTSTLTAANIILNATGNATGTVGLTGSGLSYTVTISGITGSGTLGISIPAGTASDLAGNLAPAAGPSATFTVTPVSATIVSLTKTGASPTNAASVSYTATFSSAVTGLTASNFSLTTTGTLAGTSIGTPTTTDGGITWTIAVNTGTGDGNLTLNLANGTGITPAITSTLPFAGGTYIIDKTAPAIAISAPSAASTITGPVTYTVTYSDANFGTSALTAGNITLNTTGTATGTVGVTGSGTTYTVTISGITGTGSLGISIAAGTATDLAGNTAGAAGPSATFTVAPPNTTIVSLTKTGASPTNAASVSYTATFGAAITGLTAANFSVTTTGTLAGTSVGTPTTTDGGLTWTVTVNTGTGDGNLTLNLVNTTGLTPGISTTLPFAGDTYIIDKTPPVVVSINTVGATANTATTEQFNVTFSEAVTGVDISDFSLVNTGSVVGTISGISGSSSTYTVTISGVSGNGTMKLNLKSSGTGIADIAGNPIATGFTTGQVYILGDATNAAATTLTIYPGTLTPAFDPATKAYTAEVSNTTESVAVTVTTISGATIAINGAAVAQAAQYLVALNIGNNTISVVITAPDGTTTSTYTIVVYRGEAITSISATNILTPNGDGKNDVWVIKDIELYPNNVVTVYDKAGRIVFSKHGYLNDWGGTYNGTPLVQGTYYYTVDLGTYLRRFTGYISILRN